MGDQHEGIPCPPARHDPPTGAGAPGAAPARRRRAGLRSLLRRSGITPVAWLLGWALCTAASLGWARVIGWLRGPVAQGRARERALRRATTRGVAILGRLKGAFAKAGQFASLRHDLVPAYATLALAALREQVPPLDFEPIRRLLEAELGRPLHEVFSEIEPRAIAAASIAQVHQATLADGRRVVVKVQYPWLEASLPADVAVLRGALRLWLLLRPGRGREMDLDRFFAEFAEGLAEELDFRREGRIAREIAANLAHDDRIVVPEVLEGLTTRRVLTTPYYRAVSIGDRAGLRRLGVDSRDVLEVLTRAYAKQVFVDGLFHADPHPGNLHVLDEPQAAERPRLLFVDFGLCRRLDPELRRRLRQGIYALLQRDPDGFVARMQEMEMIAPGAERGVRAAVATMFERIASGAGAGGVLTASGSQILQLKDEARRLLQETPGLQLPNDLLLYAKTLSYLFALGRELDPDVDLMRLSLPYLLRFLAAREPS